MKTILVLSQHPALPEGIRAVLNPEQYRVINRLDVEEAEPLLAEGLVNTCILDVEFANVQAIWAIEKLRRRLPRCPLLLYTGSRPWEWEEEAYLKGVSHVLTKPARGRMLNALLERLGVTAPSPLRAQPARRPEIAPVPTGPPAPFQALEALRDFSAVLTHSLHADAMLKQFLLLLREIIGVNRAAIFLRRPTGTFGMEPPAAESRRLRSACAIGLAPSLLEHFELSFETGIGGYLFRQGRILRRESPEAEADLEIQKEFDLLGAQVAIPMLDRENLVGVAAFDGRVTGEPLTNAELGLIFPLLEELGLAVKNVWLHDQLAANHEMLADILRELSSACVVISRDLEILHANKTARRYFARPGHRGGDLEFSDLPPLLGSKVYQVLKTGTGIATFKFEPSDLPGKVYNVTIVPFQRQQSMLPNSALLMVEDQTQTEQFQRLEIEAANLRLVRTMADRLAHEIGNALVPLSTHQQLLADKYKDPEFRASLDVALADGVKRVSRLINQMRFLSRDSVGSKEAFPLTELIQEAYQEAQKHQPIKSTRLKQEVSSQPIILSGDRAALKHALAEIILNALQANPADAKVGIHTETETNGRGTNWVHIDVQDNGAGFTPEAAKKVPEPFFTTRNVGLGLGLTVSRKIIETHRGKLVITGPSNGSQGTVRVSLPLEATSPARS
jgi:nitrogen-specific signal transduction histidine kinase